MLEHWYTVKHAYNNVPGMGKFALYNCIHYSRQVTGNENHFAIRVNSL